MKTHFIHLRLHTEFSISNGLITIPELMKKLKIYGMPAAAITDLNNMYATIKFYQAAIQAGIKPIIGVDIRLQSAEKPQNFTMLTLLCQNKMGYNNLLQLVSKSFLESQDNGFPMIHKTWLSKHAEGLIVLSGAQEGELGKAILDHDKKSLNHSLKFLQKYFPERLYIEINRVGKANEEEYIAQAVHFAHKNNLPMVATNNAYFLQKADFEAHEARVCIQQGVTLNDKQRSKDHTEFQYVRSSEEMMALFEDIPEAIENTVEIAKRCNLPFTLGKNQLPYFAVPQGETPETYLTRAATTGLEERLQKIFPNPDELAIQRQAYDQRLQHELHVINSMGFASYFLIVADFTHWAKEHAIPVGPGRGSGAGSVVAFALKITGLDPLAMDLLFERFLNPERVSMPDFDIDFCIEGRDRVIEYVMQKHGQANVAQIITYGTMAAKAVVRDAGRVLGLRYGFVDKIAKLIPFELGITLSKALELEPLLKERYQQEDEVRTLIDLARKLEGLTRNVGTHAGGIVIAPGKLTDFVPLYCEPNDALHPVTQFDKDDVEAVGLVKFDFLGLKTLTIIDRALNEINKDKHEVDINTIPLNDAPTFTLLKACKSTGVFQLESHGMRDIIKRLQPDCFEDLIALVALYRPGPLQSGMVDDFINRKHGRAKVHYAHPDLEPILRPTYGVILYQEQVMQIAQVLAEYTLGAADILRHAMGKKKTEEMAQQRQIFCTNAVRRGINEEIATHIYDLMEKFAGYGFNKAHSACYALIAYQTAWLKVHYPAAFMSAVLSSDMDKTEKIIILLDECAAMQLHIAPPDINKSFYAFHVVDKQHILYGLGAIKGVGQAAIENIIEARKEGGLFKDLFDFCKRLDLRKVNRRVLEALIKSGSFDSFGVERSVLLASLNNAMLNAEQTTKNNHYGQKDLLSEDENTQLSYTEVPPWQEKERLVNEKETLGFYLSGHPLNQYLNELSHLITDRIVHLKIGKHSSIRTAGLITNIRIRQTKKGDRLAVFQLEDGTAHIEIVCFSDCFNKYRHLIVEDQLIIIEGDLSIDDFNHNARITGRKLYTLEEARDQYAQTLQIHPKENFDPDHFQTILKQYAGGKCQIVLTYNLDGIQAKLTLDKFWTVNPTEALIESLQNELAINELNLIYM